MRHLPCKAHCHTICWKRGLFICISLMLVPVLFFLSLYLPFPELSAFRQRDWSTRIYDRNGCLIQILALENGLRREYTPLEQMPEQLVRIFIEAEDHHFFSHHGVDMPAVARAAWQNILNGRRISGASTITMQLARMIIPAKSRNIVTKLREAWYALRIERRLTKYEILNLYLNCLPFGFQVEGITSAARSFFACTPAALTIEQMCCLAVVPRRPADFNPLVNPVLCAQKAALLYKSIYTDQNSCAAVIHSEVRKDSRITEAGNERKSDSIDIGSMMNRIPQRKAAKETDGSDISIEDRLLLTARRANRYEYPFYMPHYVEFLKQQYRSGAFHGQQHTQTNSTPQTGIQTAPYPLPAEWYLTADVMLSNRFADVLRIQLQKNARARINNGAIFAIENKTGNVIVWVGSNSYFDFQASGQINGVTTLNQSGSSMKPFLYALALEKGWKPSDILPDIPMQFGRDTAYIPRNFNNRYNGPVRFRNALASSLNIPAVFLLQCIGENTYYTILKQLQFNSINRQEHDAGLSIALGSTAVSLYELVQAFSVFPRDGILMPLRHFQENKLKASAVLQPYLEDFEQTAVYSPDTARLICSILSDRSARVTGFGFNNTLTTPFPAIFKTGTANQFQSLIALAASPVYTVGVWFGNFAGHTVVGKTGSSIPAFIARELLIALHGSHSGIVQFEKPVHWHLQPICPLSGMLAGHDCPHHVMEYMPDSLMQGAESGQYCSWHTTDSGKYTIRYPEQYQRWFSLENRKGRIEPQGEPLTIIRPSNGNYFFSADSCQGSSSIPFEITGGSSATADILYDGSKILSLRRPFLGEIPAERGKHYLQVRCGYEEVEVHFTVE